MLSSTIKKSVMLPLLLVSLAACSLFEGRETTGQYVDDSTVTAKVKAAFVNDAKVSAMQVNVETMQGVVQLSGFVDSTNTEQRAVSIAQGVKGVRSVQDHLTIR